MWYHVNRMYLFDSVMLIYGEGLVALLSFARIFEFDNFLRFSEQLRKAWGLTEGDRLYVTLENETLLYRKDKQEHSISVEIEPGFGIRVCRDHLKALNIRTGDPVSLTLAGDVLKLRRRCQIIHFSSGESAACLMEKLSTDLDESSSSRYGIRYSALLEDIYMFLILNNWDSSTVRSLLEKKSPLRDLVRKLRSDDEFNRFFQSKMQELVTDYLAS